MNLEERIALLEFQMELLFGNTDVDRLFFEEKINREQYKAIMDLMESIRDRIDDGEKVHHYEFESAIYEILSDKNRDYHLPELIAKEFAMEGRWVEVFQTLYGDMPKFQGLVFEK